jgi:hypothetical protein
MARSTVVDKDEGFRALVSRVRDLRGANVKVGVTASIGKKPKKVKGPGGKGKISLVEAAWYNEYGTDRVTKSGARVPHVPPRPFIGTTADEQKGAVGRLMTKLGGLIIDGVKTVKDALAVVGEFVQGKIQMKIRAIRDPANAPSTIKRKGSSNPLIATAQMLQSIRYEVNVPRKGISEEGGG